MFVDIYFFLQQFVCEIKAEHISKANIVFLHSFGNQNDSGILPFFHLATEIYFFLRELLEHFIIRVEFPEDPILEMFNLTGTQFKFLSQNHHVVFQFVLDRNIFQILPDESFVHQLGSKYKCMVVFIVHALQSYHIFEFLIFSLLVYALFIFRKNINIWFPLLKCHLGLARAGFTCIRNSVGVYIACYISIVNFPIK